VEVEFAALVVCYSKVFALNMNWPFVDRVGSVIPPYTEELHGTKTNRIERNR